MFGDPHQALAPGASLGGTGASQMLVSLIKLVVRDATQLRSRQRPKLRRAYFVFVERDSIRQLVSCKAPKLDARWVHECHPRDQSRLWRCPRDRSWLASYRRSAQPAGQSPFDASQNLDCVGDRCLRLLLRDLAPVIGVPRCDRVVGKPFGDVG